MNKLKYYREQKGLSREALADRVGVSVETIKTIESGLEVSISTRAAAKISETLEQEPSEIFDGYELRREEERNAMYGAAIALYRAKEAIEAITYNESWSADEEHDPKIAEADNRLSDALDAAGITDDARDKVMETIVDAVMAYSNHSLIRGMEIGFGLVLHKTSQEPKIEWGKR